MPTRLIQKCALFTIPFLLGVLVGQETGNKPSVLWENERVRVREVILQPGVAYPEHTHDLPHVGVIIKGGTLEFTEQGKKDQVSFKAGDAGWRDAGVTHSITNLSPTPVHVVEVELKN